MSAYEESLSKIAARFPAAGSLGTPATNTDPGEDVDEGEPRSARIIPITTRSAGAPAVSTTDTPETNDKGSSEADVRAALGDAARDASKQGAIEDLGAIAGQYRAFRAQTGEVLVVTEHERINVVSVQSEAFMRRLKVDIADRRDIHTCPFGCAP